MLSINIMFFLCSVSVFVYCVPGYRYHVNVTIDGAFTSPGEFKVALYGTSSNTHQYRIFM